MLLPAQASVKMLIFASGAACSIARPQLVSVAPVVSTSSTRSICLPLSAAALVTLKIFSTFFQRSSRCLCVCVSLALWRMTLLLSMEMPVTFEIPRAI